ncbi:MAG: hypothetical protein E7680_05150 [Ruminococcaceae bacterium]|nr:hypothetical protein [Oscillospiraceae bacterium]
MNQPTKIALIVGGSVTAGVAMIAAAVAIWNNRQLKLLRTYKKAGKILGRVGTIFQSVSEAME